MAVLSSSFILLVALIQNVFYVSKPNNVVEGFICFQNLSTTTGACSWPEEWIRLYPTAIRSDSGFNAFRTHYLQNTTADMDYIQYKIKLIFSDRSMGEQDQWQIMLLNSQKWLNNSIPEMNLTCVGTQQETNFTCLDSNLTCADVEQLDRPKILVLLCVIATSSFLLLLKCIFKLSRSTCRLYF